MTARRSLLALSAAAIVAAGLAGCSTGSPPAPTSADRLDSPLVQYLGPLWRGLGTDEERKADHDAIESVIATCMTAEGFEYTPVAFDPESGSFPGDWRLDDRDWVAQWGYGAIDFPAYDEVMADMADGDENTAYYESLGPGEQQAYSDILWGPVAAADPGGSGPTWEQLGCHGYADHEVYGDDPRQSPEHEVVMDAVDAFFATQFTAPEYAELDAEWAECMADAEHPGFTRQGDARDSIFAAVDAVRMSQATFDDEDPAILQVKEDEIDLALADLDCREQTDYRARSLAIQYAQEEQFIDDHRAELDALVADAEAGGR